MRCSSLGGLAFAAVALVGLGGCQMVGPKTIGLGRDRYNSIIQLTSMEQTMSNIVRVYNHEPTLFMDITEVDATVSFGGSVTGATTNIGARAGTSGSTLAGQVGSLGAAAQYSETPTIRYQPLLGQPLVAQMVTPVSVDALGLLYDSYWNIAPLLDFSAAYLTLDYREFYVALNTIDELNSREALELVAGKSDLLSTSAPEAGEPPSPKVGANPPSKTDSSQKAGGSNNDSLIVYLRPFHRNSTDLDDKQRVLQLWIRMLRLYGENQPPFVPTPSKGCIIDWRNSDDLKNWDQHIGDHITGSDIEKGDRIDSARKCLPNSIELRVVPAPKPANRAGDGSTTSIDIANRAPLMRTYSALGILKNATERPSPKIEFVTPHEYREIREEPWNDNDSRSSYYTLLPSQQDSIDCSSAQKQKGGCDNPLTPDQANVAAKIAHWIQGSIAQPAEANSNTTKVANESYISGLDVYEVPGNDVLSTDYIDLNGALGTLRRYILIVVDDHLPLVPVYVSYTDGQRWYYIAKEDAVSERNFQLMALFTTMMAVPPSTQPLSPVINVGG